MTCSPGPRPHANRGQPLSANAKTSEDKKGRLTGRPFFR